VIRRIVVSLSILLVVTVLAAAGTLYWFLSGDGIRQALEQQASAWLGQPVHIATASAQLLPRPAVRLGTITVGEPVSLTLGSIVVSTGLNALLHRRIEDAEVIVSDSRIQMPLPSPVATRATGATGGPEPIRLVSIRSIALDNVRFVTRGRGIVVSAESALDGTRLAVHRFEARSGQTTFQAEGLMELSPRVDATMRIKAGVIDVDELLELAEAFVPEGGGGGSRPAPRIAARVSAERARAGGVEVRQFATDMLVDGDRVSLSPLTFQLFGGRYQGSLSARLGPTLQASLNARIIDLDVAQLASFGGVPGAVTGTLTGAGSFSGRGADIAGVLGSARGEGTATVVKGTIQRLNLVRTVVLFFGRPAADAAVATDEFERMDLRFSLGDRVFDAQAFSLQSSDADIVGSGTLHVATKALNGQLDLSLSEALSAQAGTDLQRYTLEGSRIVLPALIGGTLGEPRLRIDAAAAVERGLRNEVKRRLGGLLDRFAK
jgi:uncharacterized protein involved in outer membrane biogenesis